MTSKRTWVLLAALLLVGGVGVATAGGEEPEIDKDTHIFFFNGGSWLGVQVGDVTAEKAREWKLSGERGAVIEEVEEESPAAKAGLQANDVILSFDGEPVRSVAHLVRLVQETPAGRKVSVQVSRGGQTRAVEVTLEGHRAQRAFPRVHMGRIEVPPIPPVPPMPGLDIEVFPGRPRLGISADELTPQLADYFGVKQGKGILVREVLEGSAAAKAGLKAGDVIVRVEEEEIADVQDLRQALRRQRESKEMTLTIVRERREQAVKVTLDEPQPYGLRRMAEADSRVGAEAMARAAAKVEGAARRMEQRMREAEKRIQHYTESGKFKQQLRKLEKKARELERELRSI